MLLEAIRGLVHAHIEQPDGLTGKQLEGLVIAVDLLDGLLTGGGPLPAGWKHQETTSRAAREPSRRVEVLPPL